MIILKYNAGKLYLATVLCGLGALFFLWLFLHPHEIEHIRKARLFATGLGHGVLAPGFFLACLGATVNFALLASGDLSAIKVVPDGLRVRNFWKSHHIRWSELLRLGVERKEYRNAVTHYLCFDVSGGLGQRIKLNIQHTDVAAHALQGVIDDIQAQWAAGKGSVSQTSTAADGDFDPDAALARYMARKASGEIVPVEAPAPAPVRPSFGRKVV